MKNRKMLLPALISIALVFSLILPALATGASATMHWPDNCSISHSAVDGPSASFPMVMNTPQENVTPMVAVGDNSYGQCDVGDWNLALSLPPSQEVQVGVKAGDWIKVEYKVTGWPGGQPYPEWLELEFLSVEGTNATTQVTMHMSDGTEQSETVSVEVATGGGEAFGLSGFVISANLKKGDSFYMTGYGNVAIEGETTRTYGGARRTVVYTSFSQYVAQFTYYWDKLTGVLVEASIIYGDYADMTATAKAIETNMWEADPPDVRMPWWPWIIVAVVAVGLVIFFIRRRGRVQADTSD